MLPTDYPNTRHQGLRARSTGGHSLRFQGGAPRYYEQTESGVWNGNRPSFFITCAALANLSGSPTQNNNGVAEYQCEDCLGFFAIKSHANGGAFITIDHITPWDVYIRDNAAPNTDGRISSQSARDAYNDIDNLKFLCNSCNSSKNGYSL
jgi:hypothetical protein